MKGIIIYPSGVRIEVTINGLESMQDAVGGGYVELIGTEGLDCYVNEDGIAKRMPPNPEATRIIVQKLREENRLLLTASGSILGPALFMGPPHPEDGESRPTDCPPLPQPDVVPVP